MAARCAELAALLARRRGREPAYRDVRDVLAAVSATPKGKFLDSLVNASTAWLETTLRACDTFEHDQARDVDAFDLPDFTDRSEPSKDPYTDTISWVEMRGGRDVVIEEARAWLRDHPATTLAEVQVALDQWANQAHAPPKVVAFVMPDVYHTQQKRTARGG